jgi:hypothetical protein
LRSQYHSATTAAAAARPPSLSPSFGLACVPSIISHMSQHTQVFFVCVSSLLVCATSTTMSAPLHAGRSGGGRCRNARACGANAGEERRGPFWLSQCAQLSPTSRAALPFSERGHNTRDVRNALLPGPAPNTLTGPNRESVSWAQGLAYRRLSARPARDSALGR